MIYDTETKTPQAIREAIKSRQVQVGRILEGLPYADGPAYFQDKQRVQTANHEIAQLRAKLQNPQQNKGAA